MKCNCTICKENKALQEHMSVLTEEQQEFFTEMAHKLMEVETQLNYYMAVIHGTWPNADILLKNMRAKYIITHPEDFI